MVSRGHLTSICQELCDKSELMTCVFVFLFSLRFVSSFNLQIETEIMTQKLAIFKVTNIMLSPKLLGVGSYNLRFLHYGYLGNIQ